MKVLNATKIMVNAAIKRLSSTLSAWTTSEFKATKGNARPYVYTLPNNYTELPYPFAEQFDKEIIINPHKIYYLHNVYATWQGIIFKNFRIFVPSLMTPMGIDYFREALLLKQWLGKIINFNDSKGLAIAYNQYAPHNYFHWIVDSLPRLLLLKEFHPDIPLLLPKNSSAYITQTAAIFGFTKFVEVDTHEVIKAKKIVLPDEHAVPLGHNDPELIRKVRALLIKNLGNPDAKATRRLYLSRERQKLRKVQNQLELDILLDKYGFEKVYFEGLSIKEQIQMMQEAAVILGVHGANLVNCLFVPETTPLIEMQSLTLSNPSYWRICSALSIPYYCLPCSPVVDEPISNHSNVDIIVDLKKLENILCKVNL